jgi:hypothetical protein
MRIEGNHSNAECFQLIFIPNYQTMPSLTEQSIENNLIDLLKGQGYEYFYGPDIAPYGSML